MEEIGELIGKGFGTWKSNLNLCLPFILSFFVSILVMIPVLVAFALTFLPLASMDLNATTAENAAEMQNLINQTQASLENLQTGQMAQIALFFVVLVVLMSLVSAFFTAGAIGMARSALDRGKTDLGDMWSAGRENFMNMFLANILMGLLTMAGLVFLIPGIALLPQPLEAEPQAVGALLIGILLLILYALALSLLLATTPYALVVEKLGAVNAVKASIDFFRYNKFDVLILWLVVLAISMSLQMISGSLSAGEGMSHQPLSIITGLISILVLAPLSNVWWTRLYMNRKGLLKVDDVRDPW